MSFQNEPEAFEAYASTMPNNATLLVDTYDTLEGVKNAILTGRQLREKGHDLQGIRLDSGDLTALSIGARQLLDEAGFHDTQIIASNDLDVDSIRSLKAAGARIDTWGVGTNLVTSADQPALGGVYKLGAIRDTDDDWQYKIKLSNDPIKVSNPGILQVAVTADTRTIINEADSLLPGQSKPLLIPAARKGKRILPNEPIGQIRENAITNWKALQKATPTLALHPALEETKNKLLNL